MRYNSKRLLQIIVISIVVLLILVVILIVNIKKNNVRNEISTQGNNTENLDNTTNEILDQNTTVINNQVSENDEETIELSSSIYPNLNSPKDVCDYLGCTYIETKKSTQKNYSQDIYMTFGYETTQLIGKTVTSNKSYYEDVITNIVDKMTDNFRIIDESHSITINVKVKKDSLTGKKSATYLINNDPQYFEDEVSKVSLNEIINSTNQYSNIEVKNEMIQSLINNNWNAKLSVQNMKSQDNNYYVYDGYKVRMLDNKVYNVIFDENYKYEIFNGIKTGNDQTEIYDKFKNADYYGSDISSPLGYRAKDFYVFFYNGKISIYRKGQFNSEKNEQLNSLMTKYNQDGDYMSFVNNITQIYTDYTELINNENKIDIKYPLEGFEIRFGYKERNGITLYDNFEGKIVNGKILNDILKDGNIPPNVYIVNDNLMNQELDKTMK